MLMATISRLGSPSPAGSSTARRAHGCRKSSLSDAQPEAPDSVTTRRAKREVLILRIPQKPCGDLLVLHFHLFQKHTSVLLGFVFGGHRKPAHQRGVTQHCPEHTQP